VHRESYRLDLIEKNASLQILLEAGKVAKAKAYAIENPEVVPVVAAKAGKGKKK
jgi:hypothetical protein